MDNVAQEAYQAYGRVTEFKNYQGEPMPEWHELPEKTRRAWFAAAVAVADYTLASWIEKQSEMVLARRLKDRVAFSSD